MPLYQVTLRGVRTVEATINLVADTGQQAMKLAQAHVDDVVANAIDWDIDYEQPVRDVRPIDAVELE